MELSRLGLGVTEIEPPWFWICHDYPRAALYFRLKGSP